MKSYIYNMNTNEIIYIFQPYLMIYDNIYYNFIYIYKLFY